MKFVHVPTCVVPLLAVLCLTLAGTAAAAEKKPLSQVSAKECERCHEAIYKEWKGSMHASSTALENPIHGGCYNNLVGDGRSEGQIHKITKTYPVCLYCHAPNAATDQSTKLDAFASYREGVNCLVCHRLARHHPGITEEGEQTLGIASFKTAEVLQGPNGFGSDKRTRMLALDDEATNPHVPKAPPTEDPERTTAPMYLEGNPDLFRSADLCLGCHTQRRNPHGVPVLHAEPDFMLGASKGATCQGCHMPALQGHVSHAFPGGRDPAMLRKASRLKITAYRENGTVKAIVAIENRLPHKLPTGAPFRGLTLRVSAFDASGKRLWRNYEEHPEHEDPKSYFHYPILDEQGNPVVPPKGVQPGPDSRLMAFEKRAVEYEIPGQNVAFIQAELFYHVLTPEMHAELKEAARHVLRPHRMSFAEAAVNN